VAELASGAVVAGRWIIERPLSSGGMGTVYVAKHAETGRPVALKVIKVGREVTDELISRFRKETGALAAVSHPNVVTFLDSGVDAPAGRSDGDHGRLYLVMELLSGRGLRSIMTAPIEPARALRICADVCRALAAVHEKGIVHRDLKPENVFLVDAVGHDEIAKLIDFGIARLEDASTRATATATGAVVGTPGYISPEQLRGDPATVASDVYAVGVILYELVTGKFPFAAPSTHAMLVKQLMEPLPAPRSVLPSVPEHVEQIICALMERDPTQRVRTAKDALALLVDGARATPQATPRATSLPPGAMTEAGTAVTPFVTPSLPSSAPSSETKATPLAGAPIAPATALPKQRSPVGLVVAGIGCLGIAFFMSVVLIVGILAKNERDKRDGDTRNRVTREERHVRDDDGDDDDDDDDDDDAHGSQSAQDTQGVGRFAGRYTAAYQGTYQAAGMAAPEVNTGTAKATLRAGKNSDVVMKLVADGTGQTCEFTFERSGDIATFAPPEQSCTFMNPDGSRQTNTSTGRAVLQGKDIDMTVSGTFIGALSNGLSFAGGYTGTWHLTRGK
jgi:serine/threonine protein kinase